MSAETKPCNVGGQAVIEGVMMRSPRSFAIACRRPSGELVLREERWRSLSERHRFLRWPLLRGGVVLLESLMNGLSALTFSAREQERATAAPGPAGASDGQPAAGADPAPEDRAGLTGVLVVSLLGALLVFKALPHLLTWLLGLRTSSIGFHLVDGALKAVILVAYVGGIGLMKDVRRVFMYHGAEHKAIWAYERGLPLDVAHARQQSRFHPRCGTSFLVLVIFISILLFALLLRHPIVPSAILDNIIKILIKVPLMFPVAGLGYEAIKLSGRFRHSPLVRALVAPGMLLQRLTTREPTDDQLEVALLALQKTLWREQVAEEAAGAIEVFGSYAEALPAVRNDQPAAA
jgi:uncharacterized protein YqhQ